MKSTWKAIIKEKSEKRMNREIQQKTAANNNIQHGIHNKHDKQRNGGHGNDTRQNVEENIQSTSINPILGVTD